MDESHGHWFTKYLKLPVDGPEHVALREQLWIGGADQVSGYYLSMLTGRNQLSLTLARRWEEIRRFILKNSSPRAISILHEPLNVATFSLPLLKQKFDAKFGQTRRVGKEERALVLLLTHPDWSDERIRAELGTTLKQMNRWSLFKYARIVQERYNLAESPEESQNKSHPKTNTP